MEETKIGPIQMLRGPNKGKYPHCHSLYIEGAGVLIDPASDRERLVRLREEEGVRMIWLTHWHEDHLMHWDLFSDVPLWIGRLDAPPLLDMETFLDWYNMDRPTNLHLRDMWRSILKEQFHYMPRTPDRLLDDGEMIDLNGIRVKVIHSPGHTPGHLAFWFPDHEIVFLGDYDLTPFGPWYGDRHSSINQTLASAEILRNLPASTWFTCHETGIFYGDTQALWDRYLAVIDRREERLLEYLGSPRTMEDIIGQWIVYGKPREPKDYFIFGERSIMDKHLERLKGHRKIYQDGAYYCIR
ncbi:MAG: MBL fold metallo-hydrolase [Desulfobacteraceae bacterium]|nr:MAG: MBL fold metallo-hydrolase [Desulfobacteraceae bacterium]